MHAETQRCAERERALQAQLQSAQAALTAATEREQQQQAAHESAVAELAAQMQQLVEAVQSEWQQRLAEATAQRAGEPLSPRTPVVRFVSLRSVCLWGGAWKVEFVISHSMCVWGCRRSLRSRRTVLRRCLRRRRRGPARASTSCMYVTRAPLWDAGGGFGVNACVCCKDAGVCCRRASHWRRL